MPCIKEMMMMIIMIMMIIIIIIIIISDTYPCRGNGAQLFLLEY